MRARLLFGAFLLSAGLTAALVPAPSRAGAARWRQVHPFFQGAYVLSFRSPDLLGGAPDEQWGVEDRRLVSGGILSEFPRWLSERAADVEQAHSLGRPILLSIHVHSGFGTGLVTYSDDLRRAEVANYPWLMRRLLDAGLGGEDVTVTVDTCNAQATAAHQIRPDLSPAGVRGLPAFQAWARRSPVRRRMPLAEAYRLFAQEHVATHLGGGAKGRRGNVAAQSFQPLAPAERSRFRARLYGPKGVIVATPAFFNLLRLGPEPRYTQTANLLTDRLELRVLDGGLAQNRSEFARFQEFTFLASSGIGQTDAAPVDERPAPRTAAREQRERAPRD